VASVPGVTPVPESGTLVLGVGPCVGELEALLTNWREADTGPPVCGVKATLNGTLCPAGIVKGSEGPWRTNCELLLLAEETVTLAPVALRLSDCVFVVPTASAPNVNGAGAMINWPVAAAVPVPASGMAKAGPETNRLPALIPVDCGAKVTFNVTLCPVPNLMGKVGPLSEIPAPVVWRPKSVTAHDRAFVSTTGTVALVPIATCPNDTIEGLAVTAAPLMPEPST
jgi:hypothetical protein